MQGYAPLLKSWENFYVRRLYHRIQVRTSMYTYIHRHMRMREAHIDHTSPS
jgi:hypothetical protein